ncbi:NAD(P)H-dependent oxidoreductase [Schlesneria sp. T3-172]|uniref:NAD(P)H-dependent oxidoreductase n=1 Tax=Schlesneria sphaerica TaxID=3373610 RepID=UPI0037C62724
MSPIASDIVERQLEWRYATKMFDPTRVIPDSDWKRLEQTLVLTPSSFGLQPWRFLVVTGAETKARLKPASWNQAQIVDASHLVIFAIKKDLSAVEIDRHLERMAEVRGVAVESMQGLRRVMLGALHNPAFDINEWASRQVYIALGFFMAAAAMMGIDTCPIEGFEPAKYDEILGLTEHGYQSTVIAAAGYRSDADKYARLPKVRFRTEDVIQNVVN